MKICFIGTGYVGLVSGACFADLGNNVFCVDNNKEKIDLLNKGNVPFFEPGLQEMVIKNYSSGRLKFTTNLSFAVKNSDIIFICVGTPTSKKNKSANLNYVYKVVTKKLAHDKQISCIFIKNIRREKKVPLLKKKFH